MSCAHDKCPQYILSKRQEVKFLSVTWNLPYHMLEKISSHEMHLIKELLKAMMNINLDVV